MNQVELPTSAVPWPTIIAGILGVAASLIAFVVLHPPPGFGAALMVVSCGVPMWALEYRRLRARAADPTTPPASPDPKRRELRLQGMVIVAALGAISVLIQTHLGGPQTANLLDIIPILLTATAIWTVWIIANPSRSVSPDSLEVLAHSVRDLFFARQIDHSGRQCLLGWCVKVFFLPLMLAWLYGWLAQLHEELYSGQGWFSAFLIFMAVLYALDTLFGTVGYLSTSKAIGGHIRSIDATWLGWLSALVCYPPLSAIVIHQWLNYSNGPDWISWLGNSWLSILWGSSILALTAVYTLSTLVFGPRFSNLTHRGIITSGPFRWTKHPAYISKNLSWWLLAVPFVSEQGAVTAALSCLALLGVNFIYWLRAKTEERHLMRDPKYRQYALWIEENGIISRCLRSIRPNLITHENS